jgi:hypothetical protein
MVNERYNVPNRERTRKATLETLDKPWASYCTTEGHEFLIRAINYYYSQRGAEAWSYGHTYGEVARRFAVKAWTTPDDDRIERLMGETYSRGYFSLDELRSSARENAGGAAEGRACQRQSLRTLTVHVLMQAAVAAGQRPFGVCAVKRRRFPVGASPTRQPLQERSISNA